MSIAVKYFANLRELIGREGDDIEHKDGLTAQDVWNQVKGDLDESTPFLAAINMEYSSNDTVVKDGDEIAFFPKVSGG